MISDTRETRAKGRYCTGKKTPGEPGHNTVPVTGRVKNPSYRFKSYRAVKCNTVLTVYGDTVQPKVGDALRKAPPARKGRNPRTPTRHRNSPRQSTRKLKKRKKTTLLTSVSRRPHGTRAEDLGVTRRVCLVSEIISDFKPSPRVAKKRNARLKEHSPARNQLPR